MFVFSSRVQPPPEMIKTVKKTPSSHKIAAKKRVEGPGSYRVVQCGSAGHNVRSKPSMRGTPVGRLGKGNTVEAVEEVSYCIHASNTSVYMYTCFMRDEKEGRKKQAR